MLFDDLVEGVRASLLRGYVEKSWRMPWLAEDYPHLASAAISDETAHEDGLRLRRALDSLFSSDTSSELASAKAEYDGVAGELNERYGAGMVVLSGEKGEPGLRGFRTSPFATETTVERQHDGVITETVRDLQADVDRQNEADLG